MSPMSSGSLPQPTSRRPSWRWPSSWGGDGARRGELCALRWADVNWPRRVLTIARSLTEIDGVASEGPTKSHQRRDVALDDALLALLTKRRADQESYAAVVGQPRG